MIGRTVLATVFGVSAYASQSTQVSPKDLRRAATRVPRASYKGDDFDGMSTVLNGHLRNIPGLTTKSCSEFTLEELQTLVLKPLFESASPELLTIYSLHGDNRQRLHMDFEEMRAEWSQLAVHASAHPSLQLVQRDGLCHEAVMWFVHHLSEDQRTEMADSLVIPLLPTQKHTFQPRGGNWNESSDLAHLEVHKNYDTKVSCQQCHSGPVWKSWVNASLPLPFPVDTKHPGLERLRSYDYQNDPPCGPCDGLGGPRTADDVESFTPLNCTVVAQAKDVPENERPKAAFPAMGHAHIDGETRSPLEVRPSKPGTYPKVNSTISLAWDGAMARHRYDFDSMPPLGTPSSQLYLQTQGQIESRNNSGVMVTILGRQGHLSVCICMDAVAGAMNINAFVPHMADDPLDLPASEGGLAYLGRIKLSPIDGGHKNEVIADHYMKWAFHFLVDADSNSPTYGKPLRLYGNQGVRFVYSDWSTVDPREANPDLFKMPKWCLPLSKTCREMRDIDSNVEFV